MRIVWSPRGRAFGTVEALGLLGLLGLGVARWVPLAAWVPFWGCSVRSLTGWPCPGCGLTRAAERVARLDLVGALRANPLGAVAAVGFAGLAVAALARLAFAVSLPHVVLSEREWAWARWLFVLAVAANYGFVVYAHRVLRWA